MPFEEKEKIYIDLYVKSISIEVSAELRKPINTEKELLDALKNLGEYDDIPTEINSIKDLFLWQVEQKNKKEGTNYTYEEYLEMQFKEYSGWLHGLGILDITIEDEQGEKLYYTSLYYDQEKHIVSGVGLIYEYGKYQVTVKVANTDIVLTKKINIQE